LLAFLRVDLKAAAANMFACVDVKAVAAKIHACLQSGIRFDVIPDESVYNC